uniref:Suppressor of cytokine signaling 7 n=2 Tax=Clastoptera arizonana TaxID=38151 RepID=A0A1B6C6H0_9HEMI
MIKFMMESPPSCSVKSSEDSGLLLTSDSISTSSGNWQCTMELLESEGEKSFDSVSLGEGYNTVKKGPCSYAIDPPLEFQDFPLENNVAIGRLCYTPDSILRRPGSRNSLSSRLSSSHNSLSVPVANKADDSSFITSAISHDILTTITDMYNVPFDSDIYTLPVDSLRPCPQRPKRQNRHRKRRRHTTHNDEVNNLEPNNNPMIGNRVSIPVENKRHSVPGTSGKTKQTCEPIHMTLQEVRQFLHNLYSSASDSSGEHNQEYDKPTKKQASIHLTRKNRKTTFAINIKHRKSKEQSEPIENNKMTDSECTEKINKTNSHSKHSFSHTLKQTLCNLFRFRRSEPSPNTVIVLGVSCDPPFSKRALPPLPVSHQSETINSLSCVQDCEEYGTNMDFASSIEKVKDYGWYWGPISGEAAEKILSSEPDGSFIVRDSSDDHYIFSLTFKLNGCVRHVRIEHDQGNFSFGSCTKFKSHTIVEFIENAVEHSRSGRYLFFLHRRPVLGPMRVQLLHPVSRFKQVQSLQHMCRFVILKLVRKDLIPTLPLPRRVIDYLSSPHYYSENLEEEDLTTASPSLHVFSFSPPHIIS